MSNKEEIQRNAQAIMEGARQRGINDVKVTLGQSRNVSVTYRDRKIDKVEESTKKSVSLHLYDEGKYSVSSTNDFRKDSIEKFLDNAVAMTKVMQPDPFRELTDPALYAGQKDVGLDLFDPKVDEMSNAQRNQLAAEAEETALTAAGDLAISAESNMESQTGSTYQVHSNGFEGHRQGSQLWLFTQISLKDKDQKRPSGWDVVGSRYVDDLGDAAAVGRMAVERAKRKLDSQKLPTGKYPMVVENVSVGRLLGGLLGAISGRALQQRSSFLSGKAGEEIGSPLLNVVDEPFLPRMFGSRLYDSEGIAARVMPVFESGAVRNFFIDTYYGKKLEMAPTSGGRSNLVVTPGQDDLTGLLAGIEKGMLVRGFVGGNSNGTTGDFSFGVHGTLIENGKLTVPISEANISGNHKELWKRLAKVGNDVWKYSSLLTPSMLFDEVQFSGV